MQLPSPFIKRDGFFERACVLKNLMRDMVDQLLGSSDFIRLEMAYSDHGKITLGGHYNHLALHL
jgi:hypothetical protein